MGGGVVQLRREGTGFLVEFIPPEAAFPSQIFTEHKAARGFAGGARMVLGRKLLDQRGEG